MRILKTTAGQALLISNAAVVAPVGVTEISTDAEMATLLTSVNVNEIFKFTGTTGTYTNGDYYIVVASTASSGTYKFKHYSCTATQLDVPIPTLSSSTLSWTAISGATNYYIYRDGVYASSTTATSVSLSVTGVYQVKATSSSSSYMDSALSTSISYTANYSITPTLLPMNIITASSSNPSSMSGTETVDLVYTISDGYVLPSTSAISVSGATKVSWAVSGSQGTLRINNATGPVSFTITGIQRLAAPTNLTASGTNVTFDESTNAVSYDVYCDSTMIGNTTGTILYTVSGTATSMTIEEESTYSSNMAEGTVISLHLEADGSTYKLPDEVSGGLPSGWTFSGTGASATYTKTSDTVGYLEITVGTSNISFTVVGETVLPQLSAPTGLSASGTTVTFTPSENATSYKVYADGTQIGTYTPPTLITFTISDVSFTAEQGMTFAQWLSSSYDHTGWTSVGEVLYYNSTHVSSSYIDSNGSVQTVTSYNGTSVYDDNVIQSGATYTLYAVCFAANTPIRLDTDGSTKNIEDIVVGDYVLSYDFINEEFRQAVVLQTYTENATNVYTITLANGVHMVVTGNHPLYTTDGLFKTIERRGDYHLQVGDTLVGYELTTQITAIEHYEGAMDMYGIDVHFEGFGEEELYDNYLAWNIIVHNAVCLLGDTLITLADGTTKRIDEMSQNDTVLAYNENNELVEDNIWEYASGTAQFYTLYTFEDDTQLKVTGSHKVYNVEKQKMINIADWNIGEHAYTENGNIALISAERINEEVQYYHIYNNLGNYFANGILVDGRTNLNIQLGEATV